MSALSDFFQAMADKIRSKTNRNKSYTPAKMLSEGIDDVYSAGVNEGVGETIREITPKNLPPASFYYGMLYRPTSDGYMIANYEVIQQSPKLKKLNDGKPYIPYGDYYAISSYQDSDLTPSSNGTQFYAGWNYMTSGGYAYNTRRS